ncbi:MAG: nitroreductase family protein [Candidatus Eisenbacteria bacterium]
MKIRLSISILASLLCVLAIAVLATEKLGATPQVAATQASTTTQASTSTQTTTSTQTPASSRDSDTTGTPEVWWEESGLKHPYDLSGVHILAVLGDDFDYHELMVIKNHWESWGAKVDLAGTDRQLTGHVWKMTATGFDRSATRTVPMDILLSEIDPAKFDFGQYRVLFFPGGNSPKSLLARDSLKVISLAQEADKKNVILAAICHGPLLLAAADVVKGHAVTAYGEVAPDLQNAGGDYVIRTAVADENVVTGNFPYFESFAVAVAEKVLFPAGGGPSEKSPFATNPVLKNIKERRSIRRFETKDIEEGVIETLIQAASWAPSPNNSQPWRFVVVRDTTTQKQIALALLKKLAPYFESRGFPLQGVRGYWTSVFSAPVHIFAFYDTTNVDEDFRDISLLHQMQAVSVACQNILLAANAMGLGSLWAGLTLTAENEIKQILKAPAEATLVTMLAVGYSRSTPLPPVRKSLPEILFNETWGASQK